ncbi:LLM class flavin-dependent oxidoreductase [Prauserella muralis]|uniref:Luciferase n=1 Tax=Prauserella muralis TaxID=588067 RepID=A0A2V4AU08_9PSEU|nr:LLM class flavin-dependent oxidoreductase [Prauserella muralis]PXY24732.1 luciferase [Prauserella muralis]TWE27625.1 alkanesulfonate monooxygenase SsuD/methylene tetrahydromethanopterin reductase-like flavin-dependent oxidoreductase (luciferase family) [Prauserella muralis]
MRLGYFAMPMHPDTRPWAETLADDRDAVILADRLGFHDAFIGEHLTDRLENITNSMIFQASLIHSTQQIRLATGTTNLSHMHPALVAANAAMMDHLSGGRFILGVSPGALPSDAEILGILDEDRNVMFADAIDTILRIWQDKAPYDIESSNGFFTARTTRTYHAGLGLGAVRGPLQQPRPEIVGTVVAPFSKGVIAMGQRDFHPLSANFLLPQWLRGHWDNYLTGAGERADTADWRVARTIFVAADDRTARRYALEDARSPYRFYYDQMLRKMTYGGRLELFKHSRSQPDEEVTLESILDSLVICGSPQHVAEQIIQLIETTGDFGEIVYAGLDWVDAELGRTSMTLMAEQVMPLVNDWLAKERVA